MMLHNRSVTGKFEAHTTHVNNSETSSCGSLNAKRSFEATITRTQSLYGFRVPDHDFNETTSNSDSSSDSDMDISDTDSDVNNKNTTVMLMKDVSLKISNINLRNYSHIKLHQATAVPNQCRPIKRILRKQEIARQRALLTQGRVQREQDRIRRKDGSRQRRNMLWRQQGENEYERIRRERERAIQEQERIRQEQERARQERERARQEQERARLLEQERARLEQERARREQARARLEQERARREQERARQAQERARLLEQERGRLEREIAWREQERRRIEQEISWRELERGRLEQEIASRVQERGRLEQERTRLELARVRQQMIVEQPRTVGRIFQTPSRTMNMEDVRLLPLRRYSHSNNLNSAHQDQQNQQCSICLELYESGDFLRTLPCFHWYHRTCIDKWLMTKMICPVCRCTVSVRGQ